MISKNQRMVSGRDIYIRIGDKRIKAFDFTWLLFLGVLPFDKAALTLYHSSSVGGVISTILNGLTLIGAVFGLANIRSSKAKRRLSQKYILFFFVLAVTYVFSAFGEQLLMVRFFSLVCLLGYYLFAICHYDDVGRLLRDVNKALFFIIALSLALYLAGSEDVMYIEHATSTVFKGVAVNRNSYSEISLFFLATNFYLWRQEKKGILWRLLTSLVAVYTTYLTNGATSIVCVCLLLLLLIGSDFKWLRKLCSFNVFAVIYIVLFVIIVVSQYSDWGAMRYIAALFEKTTSLTGRTDIWAATIESVFQAPLFGRGYDTSALLDLGIAENDPHNGLLYIALTQGIVGIIAFVGMLVFAIRNDNNAALKKDNAYMSMFIFVIVWLIKGLVESVFSYTHFVFWCALIVMELSVYNTAGEKNEEKFRKCRE